MHNALKKTHTRTLDVIYETNNFYDINITNLIKNESVLTGT